jgi:hypothetical protein
VFPADVSVNNAVGDVPLVPAVFVVAIAAHHADPFPAKSNVRLVKSASPFIFICSIHPVGVMVNVLGAHHAAKEV